MLLGGITHCGVVREAAGGGSPMVCIIWCDTHSCHFTNMSVCGVVIDYRFVVAVCNVSGVFEERFPRKFGLFLICDVKQMSQEVAQK